MANKTPVKPRRRRRRTWHVSPEGFRNLRLSLGLSAAACAKELGVGLRTVRYWDAGRSRVPWSAVRLLRLLRAGDLGAFSPVWDGWTLRGRNLWTPEGRSLDVQHAAWWSLLILQAKAFRQARFGALQAQAQPVRARDPVPAFAAAVAPHGVPDAGQPVAQPAEPPLPFAAAAAESSPGACRASASHAPAPFAVAVGCASGGAAGWATGTRSWAAKRRVFGGEAAGLVILKTSGTRTPETLAMVGAPGGHHAR